MIIQLLIQLTLTIELQGFNQCKTILNPNKEQFYLTNIFEIISLQIPLNE